MVFSFFNKQKQDDSLTLLVDIGSASVGVALVKIEKNKAPHILSTVREDIPFQNSLSPGRFILSMENALEKALKNTQAINKGQGAPAHTFCTLSSPWFILKSRKLKTLQAQPFKVTEKTLKFFLDEDIEKLKDELKETLPQKDIEIIEHKIIQMKLNGYEVENPYGQTTNQIEMVVSVGISSKRVIQSIERKTGQFFHTPSINFGAFPVAAFSVIRDVFSLEHNFLFLDITGEATDVSLVQNDLLVETLSFSYGKNFFIRDISAGFETLYQEASTLFSMFLQDTLEPQKRNQVGSVITHSRNEWVSRFKKSLEVFTRSAVLPSKVIFTADKDIASFFSGLIHGTPIRESSEQGFEVVHLDQFIVAEFASFESGVSRDPFLVVEALLAAKILRGAVLIKK